MSQQRVEVDPQTLMNSVRVIESYGSSITENIKKYSDFVDHANQQLQGKNGPFMKVSEIVEKEKANLKEAEDALDKLHASIEQFNRRAEEADDVSGFKLRD